MAKELDTAEKSTDFYSSDFVGLVAKGSSGKMEQSLATYYSDLSNLAVDGISGRPGLTFGDYYKFRPDEKPPESPKEIIAASNIAYKKIDIVRNTIDLMTDFITQGITISHPNANQQKFGQNWFSNVVNGEEVSERFTNYLLRLGNLVVRRNLGKPRLKQLKQLYKAASAEEGREKYYVDVESITTLKHEIPAKYSFIDPCLVDVMGGSLAGLSGTKKYGIVIPFLLADTINNPKPEQKSVVEGLPPDIRAAAKKPDRLYILPDDKIEVYHYKKDDWETWANPIIGSIIKPLITLEKMTLADMSALDGAISKIRIIKLGNIEQGIKATPEMAEKLNQALQSNVNGGTIDIIWSPDIDILESKSDTSTFLNPEKYTVTLMRIYAGLGIPPTLTGSASAGGTTNNFISLKTMIYRLNYCRRLLIKFWRKELAILQKAMGFTKPFKVEFDIVDFGDEAAQRALLIQMVDRNLISEERLQKLFNLDPELEDTRINKENKKRMKGRKAPKPNPLRDHDADMRKTAMQIGVATPSEVGLELQPKKPGEKTAMELRNSNTVNNKPKGVSGQGRPKNSKDSTKRKEKTFTPKIKAALESWTANAQVQINDILTPVILKQFNKKNARCLSNKESDLAELLKYGVLSNLEPFTDINKDAIIFSALNQKINERAISIYNGFIESTKEITNKDKLTMTEVRQLQITSYMQFYGDENE
jgi:hypothetical protein